MGITGYYRRARRQSWGPPCKSDQHIKWLFSGRFDASSAADRQTSPSAKSSWIFLLKAAVVRSISRGMPNSR